MPSGIEWVIIAVLFLSLVLGVIILAVVALVRSLGKSKQIAAKTEPAALSASYPAADALLSQVDGLLADGKISPADHELARSRILNAEPPTPR
jgi:hypothetical protein